MARWMWMIVVTVAGLMAACSPGSEGEGGGGSGLTISAAVSLKGALETARPELEKAAGGPVIFNFGASGTLAGQIQQGAPVDLFISADRPNVVKLVEAKAAEKGTEVVIAGNELVLVAPAIIKNPRAVPKSFSDLSVVSKLAIGEPKVVPAGAYTKEVLEGLKLWEALDKGGKLVTGENVAAVLTYVERGEVDAGIVYATDAKGPKLVNIVARADARLHSPIEYVSVVVAGSKHREAAVKVQKELTGEAVQAILKEFGFTPPHLRLRLRLRRAKNDSSGIGPERDNPPTGVDDERVNWAYLRPWLLSLEVSVVATLVNALVAIPLAYLLARRRFPLRWAVESLVVMPLVLPPTVVGFLLMFLIGRYGVYGWITGNSLMFTLWAAIIASSIVSFPLLMLPVRAAFANIPREYDEEGRIAGLTRLQRFIFIAVPLARGGILSGLLLGFARALGEFGATMMLVGLGERTRTLPLQIYYDAGATNEFAGAWPAVIALAITSMGVIVLANRLRWLDAEH